MPKEERRRQRRLARQGTEAVSENPVDATATDVEVAPTTAPALDSADSAAEDHSSAPESMSDSERERRPIALAQILANPSYAERSRPNAGMSSSIAEPAAERAGPAPEPIGTEVSGDENIVPQEPGAPNERDVQSAALPPQGARVRAQPTREPLIVALLLVALIVLAIDTYFTLRLNGLSDRLSALAAKSAAPVVTAADRPWVGVDTIETAQFANGGQPITTVHIVNSGHQPAYDLRSNTVGSLRAVATAPPQVPAQKGPLATTGMLMPNTGGKLTFFGNTRALTADEAANVKNGKYVLWLAGRLDYKDAAGHAHLTTFRYRYDPALNSFIAAPQGNSAS